jgi:hypothetical protein
MASNRRKTDLSSDKVSVQVAMPREQGNRGKKLEMHGGCLSLTDSGLPASWQENWWVGSAFDEVRLEDSSWRAEDRALLQVPTKDRWDIKHED